MQDFIRRKRMHLRMLYLTIRNMILGYTQLYHGLRSVKWSLRAIIGLRARPRTKTLKGKLTGRCEGVEPWVMLDPPEKDEPQSIWFKLFGKPPQYEHTSDPRYLGMPWRNEIIKKKIK